MTIEQFDKVYAESNCGGDRDKIIEYLRAKVETLLREVDRRKKAYVALGDCERENARLRSAASRYEFLRSERLTEMLALFPTCDTSDVGLDHAIDCAMAKEAK